MLTGYEQARSVVAAIAGDWEAARRVDLVLPETGVCSLDSTTQGANRCCGSAEHTPLPPARADLKVRPYDPSSAHGSGCCG